MAEIVLAAFNARYAHSSFGARYLLANMGKWREQTELIEFDLQQQPRVVVEEILARNPRIVGIGCYIWNIELATKVAALIKSIQPGIKIVLGGPETSYETEEQEIFQYADYVICGEGEIEFPKLCQSLLEAGDTPVPPASSRPCPVPPASSGLPRIIKAEPVDVMQIALPYNLYTDEDIAHRAIYVEASRGCPFHCEYCMSSLDPSVRYFPPEKLFPAFEKLLDRGATTFKFVDRTFNLDIDFALKVLEFFHTRHKPGMMLHFEVIPDRLPDELMEAVNQCPPGMLQFEVGIQTFNEAVAHRIQRPLNIEKIETNMRRLREETGVHIHSDLIAGLPGENLESFESGFNRLLALNPQEIQLGILKRLHGVPIDRHSSDWNMVYSPHAPYEILQTSQISFGDMQRISRFARYWNLTVNNGQFVHTAPLLWKNADSPFAAFMQWSDWLYAKTNTTGNLHMLRIAKLLLEFLVQEKGIGEKTATKSLWVDYQRGNRPDVPGFLKKFSAEQGRQDVGDTNVPPASSKLRPVPPTSSRLRP
ncbi:MAG: B12-binding domain-containing radical SAM protein, partial [Verrucomicrobia bacterium]